MENNKKPMENKKKQSYWQFSQQFRAMFSTSGNPSMSDSTSSNNNNYNFRRMNSSFTNMTMNSNANTFSMPSPHNITTTLGGGFNRGSYTNNLTYVVKEHKNEDFKAEGGDDELKKNNKNNNNTTDDEKSEETNDVVMKNIPRNKNFRITLSPSESLPLNEKLGGYIFVCSNETMKDHFEKQLFGLPPRYRDSVRAITPGMPLFLYNYTTHKLHGIFEAASFGGNNIDPTAWEDKKYPGESCFPAQVKVITRKACEPLDEDTFRKVVHHYDGPKFRLELTMDEALYLLHLFADQNFDEVFKVTYFRE